MVLHTSRMHRQVWVQVVMPIFLFHSSVRDVHYWRTDYMNSRCVIYASKIHLRDKVRVKICVTDDIFQDDRLVWKSQKNVFSLDSFLICG